MTATDNDNSPVLLALWKRLWPLADLALALLVNVLWVGGLGYGLTKLLGPVRRRQSGWPYVSDHKATAGQI